MNKAVFRKIMENMREHRSIKNKSRWNYLVSEPN